MNKEHISHLIRLCNQYTSPKYEEIRAWENLLVILPEKITKNGQLGLAHAQLAAKRLAWKTAGDRVNRGLNHWQKKDGKLGLKARLCSLTWAVLAHDYSKVEKTLAGIDCTLLTPVNAWMTASCVSSFMHTVDTTEILEACSRLLRQNPEHTHFLGQITGDCSLMHELSKSIRLISLGDGCYGWMQLNRMGLRSDIGDERHCSPLNLGQWTIGGVVSGLREKFAALQKLDAYKQTKLRGGIPCAYHSAYRVAFNHELDDEYLDENFAVLRDRHAAFAGQMAKTWQGKRIYIFVNWRSENAFALEGLIEELSQDTSYRLLVVDTAIAPAEPPPLHTLTRYVHIPRPSPDFFWVRDHGTPEGLEFDLAVRAAVKRVMLEVADS